VLLAVGHGNPVDYVVGDINQTTSPRWGRDNLVYVVGGAVRVGQDHGYGLQREGLSGKRAPSSHKRNREIKGHVANLADEVGIFPHELVNGFPVMFGPVQRVDDWVEIAKRNFYAGGRVVAEVEMGGFEGYLARGTTNVQEGRPRRVDGERSGVHVVRGTQTQAAVLDDMRGRETADLGNRGIRYEFPNLNLNLNR